MGVSHIIMEKIKMATFVRLVQAVLRSLVAGERLSEHGICYERLSGDDGRYSIQLRVNGQKIHRVIGKESEGVSRRDAEAVIERLKTEAREHRLHLPKGRKSAITFKKLSAQYLECLHQINGKNTKRKEEQLRLHLIPFLGTTPCDRISSFDIERYKAHRQRSGAALATINRELATLSHLYSCAKSWGWIKERPFEFKKFPEPVTRKTYLTPDQCRALLEEAQQRDPELYLFIRLGLATGMRASEILSIRIGHIDLPNRCIFLQQAKAGARSQPIGSDIAEYLDSYLKQHCSHHQVWLFPSKSSRSGHRMGIRKAFISAVKAIGLDPALVVRHTLRHTVVSLLIQSGVDIHTVMNITGHKTQEMVLRYSHRNGRHIHQALDKLQEKIQSGES